MEDTPETINAELVPLDIDRAPAAVAAELAALDDSAAEIISNAKSSNTRKGYSTDTRIYMDWCAKVGLAPLPYVEDLSDPESVRVSLETHGQTALRFLTAEHGRGLKASTIERRAAGIGHYHRSHGWPSPTQSNDIRELLRGLRSDADTGTEAKRQVNALTEQRLTAMIDATPTDSVRGRRDRAVILTGVHGAMRRSELAALTIADYARQSEELGNTEVAPISPALNLVPVELD